MYTVFGLLEPRDFRIHYIGTTVHAQHVAVAAENFFACRRRLSGLGNYVV